MSMNQALATGGFSVSRGRLCTFATQLLLSAGPLLLGCGSQDVDPHGLNCPSRGDVVRAFRDATAAAGIEFFQSSSDLRGGPVAVDDWDGDGLLDIAAGSRDGEIRIYRQDPALRFSDVTASVGITPMQPVTALASADLDNDGDPDFVVSGDATLRIHENRDGQFAEAASFSEMGTTEAILFVDLDGDGLLDLVLGNRNTQFEESTTNRVLRNLGGLAFADVSEVLPPSAGWTWSVSAVDFDDDGDQDLYIANDTLAADYGDGPVDALQRQGDVFLRNDSDAELSLVDVTESVGLSTPRSSMGGLVSDLDSDGVLDLYISNFGKDFAMAGGAQRFADATEPLGLLDPTQDNSLCGEGREDSRCLALSWGAVHADVTGDGFRDLIVANGDTALGVAPPLHLYTRSNALYSRASLALGCIEAQSLLAADIDGDGDVDLLSGARDGSPRLWEHVGQSAGRAVSLVGVQSNREGRGARIVANYGDGASAVYAVGSGGSPFLSAPARIFIGVGERELRSLDVYWSAGRAERFAAGEQGPLVLVEGEGTAAPRR